MLRQTPMYTRKFAGVVLTMLAGSLGYLPSLASAHEIPSDVTILAFVKPEDNSLRLLMRVPLEAMRDIQFPTFGPGYLDIAQADTSLRNAARLWIANDIELFENGQRSPELRLIAARASIPSNRAFRSYATAEAHVLSDALPASTELIWQQAALDVLFEVPIESELSDFSIRPGLERLGIRVITVIRFVPRQGPERVFELVGESGTVELDPRWHQAALRFVMSGFVHILDGIDHLLFVLCLVIPFRQSFKALIWIVTAFTVAHSATLAASAYGLAPSSLWFPPLVETLIAASIFYMAVENIFGPGLQRRWMIAFGFGLIHGFGFAFALSETLQFAGDHVLMSLLSFNIGVEIGQILILFLFLVALNLLFRFVKQERIAIIVISVLIGHTAWHWMTERFTDLRAFQI